MSADPTSPAPPARRDALAADVRVGLTAAAKWLPPKWFYDRRGSELFDEITRLPEYYPTRTERAILEVCAPRIAETCEAQTLIELGGGTSEKTRLLLRALYDTGALKRFTALDVDPSVLRIAAAAIGHDFPRLAVQGIVGDFERDLTLLPSGDRRIVAFLGSTIGNLHPNERATFLRSVGDLLVDGDAFLLGIDLVKDPRRLVAAYADAAGVTAAFNRNVLTVVNSELDADFDVNTFEHVAVWEPASEWIEMRLRSVRDQRVRIGALDLDVDFHAGEELRTEISAKFRRERLTGELARAGLRLTQWWTDPDDDFALCLSVPTPSGPTRPGPTGERR